MPKLIDVPNQGMVEFPDDMSDADIVAAIKKNSMSYPAKKPESSMLSSIGDLAAGAVRGAGSIGATLLYPVDKITDMVKDDRGPTLSSLITGNKPLSRNEERRQAMDDGLRSMGANPDSFMFGAGKLGGEIAGTAGAGGIVANGLRMVAPGASALANAIGSAGFSTAGGMGTRIAGGAINGAVSAGLANPMDTQFGGIVGAVLPPALKGAGYVSGAIGSAMGNALAPSSQKIAKMIAETGGAKTPEEMRAFADALQQRGPSLIPGLNPTVAQIAQTPALSQLQRTPKNLSPKLAEHELLQDAARRAALDRISTVSGTTQQAADNAGNAITRFGNSARQNASQEVAQKFDAIDPFGDTAFLLPIDEMQAAKSRYLGDGSFGSGKAAQSAIDEARRVGIGRIEAEAPMTAKAQQDLVLAVRSAGGINQSSKVGMQMSGEIRNLRESGLKNMTNKNGLTIERMSEKMYQEGFLPNDDPATLLDLLHESASGNKIYAGNTDDMYAQMAQRAQGPAPAGASTYEKAVPFETVQNMRSSLNEAWKDASIRGRDKEAGALRKMIESIDNRVDMVAAGRGKEGEYFPSDIVDQWRDAIKSHADKKLRFDTGPQVGMFRKGGDGQASIQAGEIPSKFFSSRGSQSPDIESFKRLAGNNDELSKLLKNYAVTDLAGQTDRLGSLTNSKVNNWLDARSGAINGLFDDGERATLKAIATSVKDADLADSLGKAIGSNTAQNAADIFGLLGNPAVAAMSQKVPFGKAAIDALKARKAEQVSSLLADPDATAAELRRLLGKGKFKGLLDSSADSLLPLIYRASPVLLSDQ